jgi:hypothetical protein
VPPPLDAFGRRSRKRLALAANMTLTEPEVAELDQAAPGRRRHR